MTDTLKATRNRATALFLLAVGFAVFAALLPILPLPRVAMIIAGLLLCAVAGACLAVGVALLRATTRRTPPPSPGRPLDP